MKNALRVLPAVIALFGAAARAGTPSAPPVKMQVLRLPGGVRFGIVGERQAKPAPTVFLLAHDLETMQQDPHYTDAGRLLLPYGFIGVTLDCPAMGEDRRPGEPPGMGGAILAWRQRLERGEDIVTPFVTHARQVLDYLVREGYTDPNRVGAIGISRGGYLSCYLAAAEPRVKVIAGLSPLIDFMSLREFQGSPKASEIRKVSLFHLAPKLAGRAIWFGVGDTDLRVGADNVIAFSRALVRANLKTADDHPVVPVELVVGPSVHDGGVGHYGVRHSDVMAANWILEHFGMSPAIPLDPLP